MDAEEDGKLMRLLMPKATHRSLNMPIHTGEEDCNAKKTALLEE
jgi:hypothetical protein